MNTFENTNMLRESTFNVFKLKVIKMKIETGVLKKTTKIQDGGNIEADQWILAVVTVVDHLKLGSF